MSRTFILLVSLALPVIACSSPEQKARTLFDQGKYEDVIAKYPDLPIAKIARDTLSARQLSRRDTVGYPETSLPIIDKSDPSYPLAKAMEKLYDEGLYDSLIRTYPYTPAANMARNHLADALYDSGKVEELISRYPNTPAGMKARNELASAEWTKISKLRGQKRTAAIVEFLKNPRYAGTESAIKAQQELNKLSK